MSSETQVTTPRVSVKEAAIWCIAKWGYLVFGYVEEVPIGGIIESYDVSGAETLGQRFVVTGQTDQDEYDEHWRYCRQLGLDCVDDEEAYPYYYRVTTD